MDGISLLQTGELLFIYIFKSVAMEFLISWRKYYNSTKTVIYESPKTVDSSTQIHERKELANDKTLSPVPFKSQLDWKLPAPSNFHPVSTKFHFSYWSSYQKKCLPSHSSMKTVFNVWWRFGGSLSPKTSPLIYETVIINRFNTLNDLSYHKSKWSASSGNGSVSILSLWLVRPAL